MNLDVDKVLIGLVIFLLTIVLVLLFVYTPRLLYVQQECARQGFPKSMVTVDLTGYCMNLEGSVTVGMKKLK